MENLVNINNWHIVDDVVMGGKSSGEFNKKDEFVLFNGHVSLENGGGFSSVRCELKHRTQVNKEIRIECIGDGREYEVICKSKDQTAYRAAFKTDNAKPTSHIKSVDNFSASFRGRNVNTQPLNKVEIEEIGIILADGKAGEFKLELHSLIID